MVVFTNKYAEAALAAVGKAKAANKGIKNLSIKEDGANPSYIKSTFQKTYQITDLVNRGH